MFTKLFVLHIFLNGEGGGGGGGLKSEQLVEKLINMMTEEFLNPFDESLDSRELYNLSSGIPVVKEMADLILGVTEVGQTCYQNFLQTWL